MFQENYLNSLIVFWEEKLTLFTQTLCQWQVNISHYILHHDHLYDHQISPDSFYALDASHLATSHTSAIQRISAKLIFLSVQKSEWTSHSVGFSERLFTGSNEIILFTESVWTKLMNFACPHLIKQITCKQTLFPKWPLYMELGVLIFITT